MAKKLEFVRCRLTGVEFKIKGSAVTSIVKAVAAFTEPLAKAMDARWVVMDRDGLPKPAFTTIELDHEVRNASVVFDIEGLANFHLNLRTPLAHKFKVIKRGDGKKKAAILALKFAFVVDGREQELLEFLKKVGGGEGKLVMESSEAEQKELPLNDNKSRKNSKPGKSSRRNQPTKPATVGLVQ